MGGEKAKENRDVLANITNRMLSLSLWYFTIRGG